MKIPSEIKFIFFIILIIPLSYLIIYSYNIINISNTELGPEPVRFPNGEVLAKIYLPYIKADLARGGDKVYFRPVYDTTGLYGNKIGFVLNGFNSFKSGSPFQTIAISGFDSSCLQKIIGEGFIEYIEPYEETFIAQVNVTSPGERIGKKEIISGCQVVDGEYNFKNKLGRHVEKSLILEDGRAGHSAGTGVERISYKGKTFDFKDVEVDYDDDEDYHSVHLEEVYLIDGYVFAHMTNYGNQAGKNDERAIYYDPEAWWADDLVSLIESLHLLKLNPVI
jgi:hypothetical protein